MKSQVDVLMPWWPRDVGWFVIGGPADENEAQAVAERFPGIRCVGFEPLEEYRTAQIAGSPLLRTDRPFPGAVHPFALWDVDGVDLELVVPNGRYKCASVARPNPSPDLGTFDDRNRRAVRARTLDSLSDEFGPFDRAVLWLDIEFAELAALRGARKLLDRTLLVNLETYDHLNLPAVEALLREHGLFRRLRYNEGQTPGKDAQDYVFSK